MKSLTHYTKGTPSPREVAPTACRLPISGTVSLPSSGCFSPFPHGTCSLSVTEEYLGLEGGPPMFRQDCTCPALLKDLAVIVAYGAITRYGPPFQTVLLTLAKPLAWSAFARKPHRLHDKASQERQVSHEDTHSEEPLPAALKNNASDKRSFGVPEALFCQQVRQQASADAFFGYSTLHYVNDRKRRPLLT